MTDTYSQPADGAEVSVIAFCGNVTLRKGKRDQKSQEWADDSGISEWCETAGFHLYVYGRSEYGPESVSTVSSVERFVREALIALGSVSGGVVLLGHSIGAIMVLRMMAKAAEAMGTTIVGVVAYAPIWDGREGRWPWPTPSQRFAAKWAQYCQLRATPTRIAVCVNERDPFAPGEAGKVCRFHRDVGAEVLCEIGQGRHAVDSAMVPGLLEFVTE